MGEGEIKIPSISSFAPISQVSTTNNSAAAGQTTNSTPPDPHAPQTRQYAYESAVETEFREERTRLNLFAQLHLANSIEFLEDEGLNKAGNFADIGCGTGYLCTSLAEKYPKLEVFGLDKNKDHIRANTDESNPEQANLKFAQYDLMQVPEKLKNKFDMANSTLVMAHMQDPLTAIENMMAIVKPGGKLSAEEIDIESIRANKEFAALDRFKELWEEMIIRVNGDTHRGAQLERLFNQAGLQDVKSKHYLTTEPQDVIKTMIIKVLEKPSIKELLIKNQLVKNTAEIDKLISDLQTGFANPDIKVDFYKLYQVVGTKPKS